MDRADDDGLGPDLGLPQSLSLDVAGHQHRLPLGVVLYCGDKVGLRLLRGQAGHPLQRLLVLRLLASQGATLNLQVRLELIQLASTLLQGSGLRVEALFPVS